MTKLLTARLIMMLAVVLVATFAESGFAADLTLNAAINKAGRQRMLTQRIIKAYAQIELAVEADASRGQLADSVEKFDVQLAELNAWTKD